jgi:hypothetical protein
MIRLLLFMHHFALAYLMHCTMSISIDVCAYVIDHVEPESEIKRGASPRGWVVHKRQVAWILTLCLDQDKPRCIPPIIIAFSFNLYNYVLLDCAFKFIGIE